MKTWLKTTIRRNPIKTGVLCIVLLAYYFCLPKQLFKEPLSTVILSEKGELLGAKIANDGQWRFPETDSIPDKFKQCIVTFEDQYYYEHPGFNPGSIIKALADNWRAGKIIRGGSTITQQVIRLSRKNKRRTYWEKAKEMVLATRLELRYSKEKIISLYASYAPFGGNVVGLEMASWRYFGVDPEQLSWAESATLAVLPNAPGLIYPGKNQSHLLNKRNSVLKKLWKNNKIDSLTYELSITEPLPQKPYNIPQKASHLLHKISKKHSQQRILTTIKGEVQGNLNRIIKNHYGELKQNKTYNAGVIVMEVDTRRVIGYVGNTPTSKDHEKDVDVVQATRSTGSILKPFLYAAMLDAGELLPNTLVPDVPTEISGYTPKNYNEKFDGAVPAKRALARSLNVPSVRLLQRYGLERFRGQLEAFKISGINKPSHHYGLTLILGGAESSLWDLCKTYASLASTVNHFNETSGEYYKNEFVEPVLVSGNTSNFGTKQDEKTVFDAGSIYLTLEAMKEVNRPEGNESWKFYDSSRQIAWKTGTSFGNRDAWAIGITKKYIVGVWVGNADGEGRPELTGIQAAAPLMFDVFETLPRSPWFNIPYDELREIDICANSGYLALAICPKQKQWVPVSGEEYTSCPYHQMVHLDNQRRLRVNSSCENVNEIISEPWFVLPPVIEFYYKKTNINYRSLPNFKQGCLVNNEKEMDFIYPRKNGEVILPKNFHGETNELILKLAHSKPETKVFWYINEKFIKQTETIHEIAILPEEGEHSITVVDELGNESHRFISVRNTKGF